MSNPAIVSASSYPYSAVVYILASFSDGVVYQGSGAVIATNVVLTASHLLYSASDGGYATSVTAYVGGSYSTGTAYKAASWNANPVGDGTGYETETDIYSDYATIGFAANIATRTGTFQLTTSLGSGTVYNAGYPAAAGGRLEADSGTATRDSYGVVVTQNVYINSGSSGGPLWQVNGGADQIVGIVSAGNARYDYYAPINETSLAIIQSAVTNFIGLIPRELYSFMYSYGDGTDYYGYIADNGTQGLYVGYTRAVTQLNGATGRYVITGDAGATGAVNGAIAVSAYYSAASGVTYMPALYAVGQVAGGAGLGTEHDSITTDTGQSLLFGPTYEAAITVSQAYQFYYLFGNGQDYYYGTVTAARGAYSGGQTIASSSADASGSRGTYVILGTSGLTTQAAGRVTVSAYYLPVVGAYYTPYLYSVGQASGLQGLGSEFDYLAVTGGYTSYFGNASHTPSFAANAFYEAGLEPQSRPIVGYRFAYSYGDNKDYYYGTVSAAAGTYSAGQIVTDALADQSGSRGRYVILGSVGASSLAAGSVTVSDYHDFETNAYYTPYISAHGGVSGSAGLGTEFDYLNIHGGYTSYFGNRNGTGSGTAYPYYAGS